MKDSLNTLVEIILSSLLGAYFFTSGYLNHFKIPETPSFEEAGYFFITVSFAKVAEFCWKIMSNFWLWLIIFTIYICIKKAKKHFKFIKYFVLKSPKINFCHFLLCFVALLTLLFSSMEFSFLSDYFKKCLFIFLTLLFITLIPFVLLIFELLGNSFSLQKHQKQIVLLIMILISSVFSYNLSYHYSGNYMNFGMMRSSQKDYKKPVVWVNNSTVYYVDCPTYHKPMYIRGKSEENQIFIDQLDKFSNNSVCKF